MAAENKFGNLYKAFKYGDLDNSGMLTRNEVRLPPQPCGAFILGGEWDGSV